jgi:hypothetical protein
MEFLSALVGLWPSTLRPLERKGDQSDQGDMLLDSGKVLSPRRSGGYAETQLDTPEQKDSTGGFPAVTGGLRTPTVLRAVATVSEAIELGYSFTQSGTRGRSTN